MQLCRWRDILSCVRLLSEKQKKWNAVVLQGFPRNLKYLKGKVMK